VLEKCGFVFDGVGVKAHRQSVLEQVKDDETLFIIIDGPSQPSLHPGGTSESEFEITGNRRFPVTGRSSIFRESLIFSLTTGGSREDGGRRLNRAKI
jgi:hypothetical protein